MAEPYTVIPLSALRKITAARMTLAKQTIPHFRLVADIEMDALLILRQQVNAAQSDRKISINDCLIKACASTLIKHPAVNIQLHDTEVHQFAQADISVVGGVATPVIRGADRKSLHDIAAESKELASRATAGRLRMSEILGGTFSISNLGAYGIDQFDAIINPPQCAILAVGRVKPRVVLSASGEMRVAKLARVTLSLDHRAIDGMLGAMFLATLSQQLAQPRELFGMTSA